MHDADFAAELNPAPASQPGGGAGAGRGNNNMFFCSKTSSRIRRESLSGQDIGEQRRTADIFLISLILINPIIKMMLLL